LADAVVKSFASSGRASLFHRVAIPYFEEVGPAVGEHRLGRLVAELFAVELGARPPFVVIERERLGQVMAEHRLVGLGMVDQQDAAEFGRILGAQSVISGTVSEAGPQFMVTVRQVEVETGQVLVTGSVGIQRDGLIALSSELVVKRTVAGAAFRSALVPGWGQIYNGDSAKGWVLAGAGAGAAATAITFTVLRLLKGSEYDSAEEGVTAPVELQELREEGNEHAARASVAWWAYGAIWALAIVDAVVNGEDYETVQSDAFVSSGSAGL
jgi:TolB-like protein